MIDCVSAFCCITRESSSSIVLLFPFIVWLICTVYLSIVSIKTYAESEYDLSKISENNQITVFFSVSGIFGVMAFVFTVSNLIQIILQLSTSIHVIKLQKSGQVLFLFVFVCCGLIEALVYIFIDESLMKDYLSSHLISWFVVIGILVLITMISCFNRDSVIEIY